MTTTSPPITLCVPSIGRLKYLPAVRAAIESQTMGDFEVLVLDNASPPEAQQIFADWARADSRVRVLRADPRIEMFPNFNRGFLHGRGKYLLYFHDDDVYSPKFVERQFEMFEREPTIAFCGSNHDFIDDRGEVTGKRRLIKKTGVMSGREYIKFVMSTGRNIVPMQSVGYRMTALAPVGIDEKLSPYWGDFVLMMRMAEKHDVGLIEEPLFKLRQHEAQFSVTDYRENGNRAKDGGRAVWLKADVFGGRARMLRRYFDEYLERHPDDIAFKATLERALRRSTRTGSVWGWMLALDDADAKACLEILGGSLVDQELRVMLRGIDRIGIDANVRQKYVLPLMRRVSSAIGNRTSSLARVSPSTA